MYRLIVALLFLAGCPVSSSNDEDLDGYDADVDCDDRDAAINPGALERCGNQVDDDCDGVIDDTGEGATLFYIDVDGDEYGDVADGVLFCSAPGDRVSNAEDCADDEALIHPGASDSDCDDVDDDCDGDVDEDATDVTVYEDVDKDGYGSKTEGVDCRAREGWSATSDDCDDTDELIHPGAPERCNGADDDCDGTDDEGLQGGGAECAVESCKELLALRPAAITGTYFLKDGTDRFEAECDMGDGGGWTVITGELMDERDWVEFKLQSGQAAAWMGEWRDAGRFRLIPARDSLEIRDLECETAVIRATGRLPFEFQEWRGSFDVQYFGNDTADAVPGETMTPGPPPCTKGAFLFESGRGSVKKGGTWGSNNSTVHPFSWSVDDLGSARRSFFWEINGFSNNGHSRTRSDEAADVYNVKIRVR
ncbi:MAG: hypothetical protein ACI9MC_001157 [Kiritimatiellia bacterium]|jgi:hypothetical protein